MRKKAKHAADSADVNVTPLLDIVFIMLIFFIVTATFTREKGIDVNTPPNTPDDPEPNPPPSMILSILENGLVQVNSGRTIDPYSVKNTVAEFLAQNPKGVVLVSAARQSASGVAVVVLDQARQAGAGSLAITLQQDQAAS